MDDLDGVLIFFNREGLVVGEFLCKRNDERLFFCELLSGFKENFNLFILKLNDYSDFYSNFEINY